VTVPFRKGAWRGAITLLVTAAVLALLVRNFGGSTEFVHAVRGARAAWVVVAFLVAASCVLLGAWRWSLVLAAMGFRLEIWRSLAVLLAVWPLAVVTPSRANELLRPLVVRDVVPLAAGAGSVLAEKAIDLFVLLVMAAAGLAVQGRWTWFAGTASCATAEALVVALVATRRTALARLPVLRRRPETVEELFGAYEALRRRPAALAGICGVSLLVRAGTVAVTYALLVAVDARVDAFDTVTLWPAAMLVGIAPLTLGGMGTRDAAFIWLLGARGAHAGRAALLAATMGYSAVAIWSFAVLGLPLMLRAVVGAGRSSVREG
jgi:uncharacterized membrane protein YbhN (UPF0104 family)